MKVIHLLDTLNRGGAEILELDVLKNARQNDLDLDFVAMNGGVLEEDFRKAGAVFTKPRRRLPIDPFIISRLRKIIKEKSAGIIHAHQAVEGIHAYLAALGTKTKTVLSHHGFIPDKKNLQALRFLIPRVSQNVVVSEALKNWYLQEAKLDVNHNLSVVYNGVDAKRLETGENLLRMELGINADIELFGMISNFYAAPRKDQLTLCRALPRIFAAFPDAHCIFAGRVEEGAEKKFAECIEICQTHHISGKVHFLGLRTDIPQILDSLDIFVLSSLHEGLPIAVLEAMLTGTACVLSDIEPLLEVSDHGNFAEIFPTGDENILAEKIIKLLKNTEYRETLALKTKSYAEANFSIEAHIGSLKKVYGRLLAK